jgi:hypothetical protein
MPCDGNWATVCGGVESYSIYETKCLIGLYICIAKYVTRYHRGKFDLKNFRKMDFWLLKLKLIQIFIS